MQLNKLVSSLALFFFSSAQASVEIRLQEWGYLPDSFEEEFHRYAQTRGIDANVIIIEPLITDFESIYKAIRTNAADVVIPTSYFYKAHHQPLFKLLLPMDFERLRNYSELKSFMKNTEYDKQAGHNYSVPLLYGMFSLAYDSKKIQEPDSWSVLLQDKYKDTFTEFCDQFEPLLLSTLLSYHRSPALFSSGEILEDKQLLTVLEEKLTKRLINTSGFWFNQMNSCAALQKQQLATTWGIELVKCNRENKQDWKIANVKEGAIYGLDAISIVRTVSKDPQKLTAAYVLVDFLLSSSLQKHFTTPTFRGSNKNSMPELSVEEMNIIPQGNFIDFDERLLIPALPANIKNRYKRMVNQAILASGKSEFSNKCTWDLNN
ncbi:hypothetical protein HMPREF1170_03275 [Aeromonas veronii AMC35]|uniref:ABC transporter substrate-binding protein n=1 Tax=Aeromonas veronii TaxID=654 RepID=UPI000280743B|nr:PotD/PotF family extracellular solute-binding protein [Aeromonas veronii]EKB20544.1 hypothetical protein HMPREF1170_03275 [Aeromonas veronii AMC35]